MENTTDSFLSDIHSSTASIFTNTTDIISNTTSLTTSLFTSIMPDINLINMLAVSNIRWSYKDFEELSIHQLYEILKLRAEVFVVEQNCNYQDLDNVDQQCTHVLGYTSSSSFFVRHSLIHSLVRIWFYSTEISRILPSYPGWNQISWLVRDWKGYRCKGIQEIRHRQAIDHQFNK